MSLSNLIRHCVRMQGGTEYGEESPVYIYIICAFSFSLKYIDLDKKHYFNIQPFFYRDILSLDRQYAENVLLPDTDLKIIQKYVLVK